MNPPDVPPPLPVAPTAGRGGWIGGLLSALVYLGAAGLVLFVLGGETEMNRDPFHAGIVVGELAGMLVLPAVLGLICWAASRRRASVGAAVFCGMVAVSLGGVVVARRIMAQIEAKARMVAVERNFVREQSASSKNDVRGSADRIDRLQKQFADASGGLGERDRKIVAANGVILTQMRERMKNYETAFTALNTSGGIDPKSLAHREDIAARREMVANCIAANEALAKFSGNIGEEYRGQLQAFIPAPGEIDPIVRGYVAGAHPDLLLAIRDTDRQIFTGMDDTLTLLDERWGHWKVNAAGKTLFENQADVARFNGFHQSIVAAAATQKAKQEEMMNLQKAQTDQSANP